MTPIAMIVGPAALANVALGILENYHLMLVPAAAGRYPPPREVAPPPVSITPGRRPRIADASPAERLMRSSRERAKKARHG